jgi:hypothetical protein
MTLGNKCSEVSYEIHAISSLILPHNAFVNPSLCDHTDKVLLSDVLVHRSVSLVPPIGNMQHCSIQRGS